MSQDLSWWAFVLSVAAIALMIPANLLANFLTPILKNWWAERSQASTKKRIETLEKELSYLEGEYPLITDVENYALRGICLVGGLVAFVLPMLGLIALALIKVPGIALSVPVKSSLMFVTLLLTLLSFLSIVYGFDKIQKFRQNRSPLRRKELRESIDKLKAKPY